MNIPLIVAGAALIMIAVECAAPARKWRDVTGWWSRAALLNGVQVLVVFAAGVLWDPWMQQHQLVPGRSLGPIWGPVVGYLTITFIYYWWHRLRHTNSFLWRWCHQIHHSPTRLEIVTSFYKHPFEILINGLLSSAIIYLLVGLSPAQASGAVLLTGLAELYYHWNIKTPWWTGFLMQRPEMHRIHHEMGVHRNNYADLPLWDILFGTFENPRTEDRACGFRDDGEQQLGTMLKGRVLEDV